MTDPNIKRLLQLIAFGLGLLLLIAGYMLLHPGSAGADPTADDVCTYLDNNPTVDGVMQAGYSLLPYSASPADAGQKLAYAVQSMCPQHITLIEQAYLTQ